MGPILQMRKLRNREVIPILTIRPKCAALGGRQLFMVCLNRESERLMPWMRGLKQIVSLLILRLYGVTFIIKYCSVEALSTIFFRTALDRRTSIINDYAS